MSNILDVDLRGLADLIEEEGPNKLVGELISNSLDEDGVTSIQIDLNMVPNRPLLEVRIEDDAPEGFLDLSQSYTLFASSYKKKDPSKAGRFNLGEKLFLAAALLTTEPVQITTTTGSIRFHIHERRSRGRNKTEKGSIVHGFLKCTRPQYQELLAYVGKIIFQPKIKVVLNDVEVNYRKPIKEFVAKLPTLCADGTGVLKTVTESATVSVYEVPSGDTAMLYELGMPVVATEDRYDVSVGQKVPLNMQRDNVKPSYLRTIRTLVFNEMRDHITAQDVNSTWGKEAMCDPRVSKEAFTKAMDEKFGEKRVVHDPSDPEATNKAIANGYTPIYGNSLSKEEWQNVRTNQAAPKATEIFPTPKPYSDDPNADPADYIPVEEWTPGMVRIANYTVFLGKLLLEKHVIVRFVSPKTPLSQCTACYGHRTLDFNVRSLGYKWFDQPIGWEVDSLLLHELSHEHESNHLSEKYYHALSDMGGKLKEAALKTPEIFKPWM